VNCILNNLPTVCKTMSRKDLKLLVNEKKKKIDSINRIREKLGKELLQAEDVSFNSSFDKYGNIKTKKREKEAPLTPRTALKSKLTSTEYEMLKEDPVYFIQNEKFKYKIKLDEDENWEKLLDGESNKKIKILRKKTSQANLEGKPFKKSDLKMFNFDEKVLQAETRIKNQEDGKLFMKKVQSQTLIEKEQKIKKKVFLSDAVVKGNDLNKKNKERIYDYYKTLEKIKKMKLREIEIEERIMKFEKEAKKAEDLYSFRLKQKALSEKIAKTKRKNLNFEKNTFEKVETPNDKMRIKYSFREF
jgi:hypothetical protein